VADRLDKFASGDLTQSERSIGEHLGLMDPETGAHVPLDDALAKAQQDLETAKFEHANALGSDTRDPAEAAARDMQAKVDMLQRVKDHVDHRAAVDQAATDAAAAIHAAEQDRLAKRAAMPENVKSHWEALDTIKNTSGDEGFRQRADELQKSIGDAVDAGQTPPKSLLVRAASLSYQAAEAAKAAEIAAKETPLKADGTVDWDKIQATKAAELPAQVAQDVISRMGGTELNAKLAELQKAAAAKEPPPKTGTSPLSLKLTARELEERETARLADEFKAKYSARQQQAETARRQAADDARTADDGNPNYPSYSSDPATAPVDNAVRQVMDAGGSGKHVLEVLARSHPDAETRALAVEMSKKGIDAPIKLDQVAPPARPDDIQFGEHVAGYSPADGSISIFNRGLAGARNMLHELVHAGTAKAVEAGGQRAREMGRLYDAVKKYASDAEGSGLYGLRDVHEFVAEAFSNPRFQEFLQNARIDGPLGHMWRSFKNMVAKALGMPEYVRTALNDVLDAGHGLMDEQLRLTDGRRVPADEAPRVGSIPDSERMMMSYASDTARELKEKGLNLLRDHGAGKLSIKENVRKLLLGWMDADGMMGLYKHYFGGEMEHFYGTKKTFDSIRERMAQSLGAGPRAMEEFARAAPKASKILHEMINDSQVMRTDWRKDWAGQDPSVRDRPDRDIIAPMVDEINRKYQAFVQNGGAKAVERLLSANRADFYSRAAMAFHGLGKLFPNAGLVSAEHPADKYLTLSDHHSSPELTEQYWKGVFSDLRDNAAKYVQDHLAEAARYPDVDGKPHPTAQKILDNVSTLRDAVNSLNGQASRLDLPYTHLGRFGDYFTAMQLRKGVAGQGTEAGVDLRPSQVAVTRLRSLLDAAGLKNIGISLAADNNHVYIRTNTPDQAAAAFEVAKKLQEGGYLIEGSTPSKGNRTDLKREMLRDMAPGWMQKLSDGLDAHADAVGVDAETKAKMVSEFHALWMDMIPDNSIARVLENREGVQGYNTDVVRNSAHRLQIGINAMAHLATTPRLFDALGAMREKAEKMKSDQNFSMNDAIAAHQVVNEIATREARRPWSLKNTFIDHVLALNHSYFLGLSPAYATELMSQIGTLMWPELSRKYGYAASATAIFRAWKPTMQVMKAVMSSGHLLDAGITVEALRKAGIDKGTVDFIMSAANRGEFELSGFTRALLGDASGRIGTSKLSTAMKFSNALAINSETMPRILAAFAARELHEGKFGKAADDVSRAALDHYVDQTVTGSMMNWSSWTTPRHLGKMGFAGALSPVMTKFMSFQIKMLERLHLETAQAFGNHADAIAKTIPGLTDAQRVAHAAEIRTESRRFLGAHTAMMVTLAGTMGLPFAGALAGLASSISNFVSNSDDADIETWYRKGLNSIFGETAGSAIAHGLPRLANVDMSELGEGRLLPFSDFMTDKRKWEDASQSMAWRAFGSPASMIGNIIRGGRDIYMGNTLNGMRELVPSSMKNAVDMYRMTNYGYVDKNGEKLPIGEGGKGEASVADILKQAVGLHSGELADYEERARSLEGYKERRQFLSSVIKVQLAKAIEQGNAEDIRKWSARASDFTATHPLNNPLADVGKYLSQRRLREVQSQVMGTPLGTRIIDPMERYYATP
jgi:hypothetical protein